MEAEEVGSEWWETGPRLCATFCRVGNKTASFSRLIVERVRGDALGGIPRLFTWKALSLSFWNREINKCSSECIRIKEKKKKKKTPKLLTQRWMTAYVWGGRARTLRSVIVGTKCGTLSPHSHLFMWRESTNIIWILVRLTLRVHTLHHRGTIAVFPVI